MKKKILSLVLISILIIMLLILTGCTNNQTNEENQNNGASQEGNKSNQEESIDLEIVAASDEDDLILLRERYTYNYYITTLSGKIIAKNLKLSNSTFEIQNGFINAFNGKIYDKNGDLVYSSEAATTAISKNGYVLEMVTEESMAEGTVKKYRIVDYKTGEILTESKYGIEYLDYEDYFSYNTGNNTYVYDAKTKERGELPFGKSTELLSMKYRLKYNPTRQKIYDFDDNELKDISEGGVREIVCYGDRIFVLTNTDYVYTLDMNFNYVVQPTKITNTDFPEEFLKLNYAKINDFEEMMKNPTVHAGTMCFTKSGIYYIDIDYSSKEKLYIGKLFVLDKDLNKAGEYEFKIDEYDGNEVNLTENGLIVKSSDGNTYVYNANGMKKFENSTIWVKTDTTATLTTEGDIIPLNLETLEEIKITE